MTAVQFITHFTEMIELLDKHIVSKKDCIITFQVQENFDFMREHIPYYLKYKEVKHEMHPRLEDGFIELKVSFL